MTVKRFLAFGLVALLAGCGGGGGGSSVGSIGGSSGGSSTPAPSNPSAPSASGWQEGVFASRDDFVAQCRAPRVGVDDNGNAFADTTGRTVDENNWLRAWTNELYLWYDEVEDMDPGLFNTPDYFDLLKTTATTASGSVKDSFHFSQNTQEYNDSFIRGISFGYGMSLRAVSTAPPREFIVWDVVADSSAGRAGVRRSQRVVEIDGEDFVNGNNVDVLNAGLFPEFDNEAHTFVLEAFDRSSRISVNLVT
ncbi:MAG: peptidase, partial [Alteromonadaceae bacterium]